MTKAAAAGVANVPDVGAFAANVRPDPFDARDLEYRPRLQMLYDTFDARGENQIQILKQAGNSCTGHAVAGMINIVLMRKPGAAGPVKVSPYMLYHLARRYDEFPGEADAGSSLRGVLKGWWRHGVALENEWPRLNSVVDVDATDFAESCRQRPLGAFYRVNALRLDDMQSAITELHAIVASAVIHSGWLKPEVKWIDGNDHHIIRRQPDSDLLGGHAFVIAGYNDIGFLVQNSWGDQWGKGGFATLPYEDWLDSAYDAWVARPGVPKTPFERHATTVTEAGLTVAASPHLPTLRKHVVNLGNDGRLSTSGKMTSTAKQVEEIFTAINASNCEDVVVFAHGGLNSETSGLEIAQKQFQWWLNNRVYPIFVVWETGPIETVINQLADSGKKLLPFGANVFTEHIDRALEGTARTTLWWAWSQMKDNAAGASKPNGGGTFLAQLIKNRLPGKRVHLVGHSAGAVWHGAFLPRLVQAGVKVESVSFLAPAITIADFRKQVMPQITKKNVDRFAAFMMSDTLEQNDALKAGPIPFYNKSLLYLVSRGFERPAKGSEVPLLGMHRQLQAAKLNLDVVVSKTSQTAPEHARSASDTHGGFDDDVATMTSVVMRVLEKQKVADVIAYQPNSAPRTAAFAAPGEPMLHTKPPERRRTPRGPATPRGRQPQSRKSPRD